MQRQQRGRKKKKECKYGGGALCPQSLLAPFRLVVPGQISRPLSLDELQEREQQQIFRVSKLL